jgi:hypothetical protein
MPLDKKGYNNVLIMVDRLSKATWIATYYTTATTADAARLYYEGPYRIHGLPRSIVSDRGLQFASEFQDEMSKILGISWKLLSPGHS